MADDNDTNDDGITQEELEQQAQRAVEEGRAMQKITQLLQDNYEQREKLRQARKKQPGEGEIVLGEDEQDQLQELGALSEDGNLKTEDIAERLSEAEEAQEELQSYKRREKRREVYEATGLNEDAAEDILPDDVDYETETVDGEDGEETKAFVVTEEGRTPVEDHIQEHYSEPIQEALFSGPTDEDEEEESSTKSVPRQTPSGEDNPSDEPDDEQIQQQKRSQIDYGI